jgi:hypothetical protein
MTNLKRLSTLTRQNPIGSCTTAGDPVYVHLSDPKNQVVLSLFEGCLVNVYHHREFDRKSLNLSVGGSKFPGYLTGYIFKDLTSDTTRFLSTDWQSAAEILVRMYGATWHGKN